MSIMLIMSCYTGFFNVRKLYYTWQCIFNSPVQNYLYNQCLSPQLWVFATHGELYWCLWFSLGTPVSTKKGALDLQPQVIKVYHLLAHGRWFSPGTPAYSTTKSGRHDIAESDIKHQKSINQSTNSLCSWLVSRVFWKFLIWPPDAFRWIFWHGRIVSDQVQVRFHKY
jgi:hypothetical protein